MIMVEDLDFVSVVIPHRGSDTQLEICLDGLRKQSYPRLRYEVLIVVNGPQKPVLKIGLRDRERVLWQPEYYSYNARNLGITKARGTLIALTDSDAQPSPSWLSEGVRQMAINNADLVAGHITVTADSRPRTAAALYELLYAFDQEKNVAGGYSVTANLFAKRSLFLTQGLFRVDSRSGEDFEWTRAAVERGASLVYAREAVVTHPARTQWSELFEKARRTSEPYVGAFFKWGHTRESLRTRATFQFRTKPSRSRVTLLKPSEQLTARIVRLVILVYKVLSILRAFVVFRRDLTLGSKT